MNIVLPEFSRDVKEFSAGACLSVPVWGAPRPLATDKKIQWLQMTLENAMIRSDATAQTLADLAAMASDKEKTKRVRVWDNEQRVAVKRDLTYKEYKKSCARGDEGARLWGFQFAHTADARSYAEVKKRGGSVTPFYIGDVDSIPAECLDSTRKALMDMPCAFAVGTSVSCRGLAVAVAVRHADDAEFSNAYFGRVFDAVQAAINNALDKAGLSDLENVCLDAAAKNGVRWRYELHDVIFKPADTVLKPIQIDAAAETKAETKAQKTIALPQAVEDLRKMPQDAPGKESEKRIEAALFACRDSKIPMDAAADAVRDALAASRPQSSRLKNGGVESLAAWVYDRPPKKKASPRDLAAEFWRGWRFDTFTGRLCTPDGERTTLDEAAALCVRTIGDISLNMARETAQAWVRHNPAAQFDGLTERAAKLAAEYTPADAGAIERYAARCGFDEYETRRLRLWLYQVAARAFLRGEKTDGMLVLCSHAEGTGKTTFFNAISRAICGDDAAAVTFGRGDDDLKIKMCMRSVMVLDEIDKLYAKKDVAEIKALITETSSFVRVPYDTDPKVRLNSAVFGATTNAESPIPSGEGEARRYWVIKLKLPIFFEGEWEPLAMMREACFLVKMAIEKAEDRYSAVGKIWVPTPEEERETAQRNGGLKVDDASTLAIAAGVERLRGHLKAVWDKPQSLKSLSVVFEVGNGAEIGAYVQWDAPRARAAEIRRVIAARCTRQTKRFCGEIVSGYTLADLAAEFCGGGTPSKNAAEFEFV